MMIVVKSSPVVFVLDIQYVSCFRAQTVCSFRKLCLFSVLVHSSCQALQVHTLQCDPDAGAICLVNLISNWGPSMLWRVQCGSQDRFLNRWIRLMVSPAYPSWAISSRKMLGWWLKVSWPPWLPRILWKKHEFVSLFVSLHFCLGCLGKQYLNDPERHNVYRKIITIGCNKMCTVPYICFGPSLYFSLTVVLWLVVSNMIFLVSIIYGQSFPLTQIFQDG